MHKHVLLLVLAIFLWFTPVSSAFSQTEIDTVSLTISPAIQEITGIPGSQSKTNLTVINNSSLPLPITLEAETLIPIDDEIDQSRRPEFDASTWISFPKSDYILEPGEATQVNADIDIPTEANPGGHYAQIIVKVLTEATPLAGQQSIVVPEVASSLFITLPGDIVESLDLNTEGIVPSYISKGSTVPIKFRVSNTGNVHLLPSPKVIISNEDGILEEINVQPQLVLPNTIKQYEVEWKADVEYGSYQISVDLNYGNNSYKTSSIPQNFRVGPAWYVIIGLGFLLATAVLLIITRKNIPDAIAVFRGKKPNNPKRFKGQNDRSTVEKDVHDYQAIAEFLGSQSEPTKKLTPFEPIPKPPKEDVDEPSAIRTVVEDEDTVKEAVEKTSDESIDEVPVSESATITEFSSDDDKDSKTVIVQTSGTTIIRQESKTKEPKPKKQPVKKKAKKTIKVEVSESKAKTTKPSKNKSTKKASSKKTTKKSPAKKTTTSKKKAKSTPVKSNSKKKS